MLALTHALSTAFVAPRILSSARTVSPKMSMGIGGDSLAAVNSVSSMQSFAFESAPVGGSGRGPYGQNRWTEASLNGDPYYFIRPSMYDTWGSTGTSNGGFGRFSDYRGMGGTSIYTGSSMRGGGGMYGGGGGYYGAMNKIHSNSMYGGGMMGGGYGRGMMGGYGGYGRGMMGGYGGGYGGYGRMGGGYGGYGMGGGYGRMGGYGGGYGMMGGYGGYGGYGRGMGGGYGRYGGYGGY